MSFEGIGPNFEYEIGGFKMRKNSNVCAKSVMEDARNWHLQISKYSAKSATALLGWNPYLREL